MALRAPIEGIKTATCKLKVFAKCPATAVGTGLRRDSITVNNCMSYEIMVYLLSLPVNQLPEPLTLCSGLLYSLYIKDTDNVRGS